METAQKRSQDPRREIEVENEAKGRAIPELRSVKAVGFTSPPAASRRAERCNLPGVLGCARHLLERYAARNALGDRQIGKPHR